MRYYFKKIAACCVFITVVILLDLSRQELGRQVQHSDTKHLQNIQQRDTSAKVSGTNFTVYHLPRKNNSTVRSNQIDDKTSPKEVIKLPFLQNETFTEKNDKRKTTLNDIFISVKTTKKFHDNRLALQVDTWFKLVRQQTYFFTDADDETFRTKTGGHMINTNCSSTHHRAALCCKLSVEYDHYIESNKRWFCHVDDDTYLNVKALEKLLQNYDYKEDWYLGKPSISHPLEMSNPEKPGSRVAFWFATGGAGFCLSQGLALKMMPYVGGGRLQVMCQKVRLPDDCTLGYIISILLGVNLKTISSFHSHLEALWRLNEENLSEHITFSYVEYGQNNGWNRVEVPMKYSEVEDPTRFRSIHCLLYPEFEECKRR